MVVNTFIRSPGKAAVKCYFFTVFVVLVFAGTAVFAGAAFATGFLAAAVAGFAAGLAAGFAFGAAAFVAGFTTSAIFAAAASLPAFKPLVSFFANFLAVFSISKAYFHNSEVMLFNVLVKRDSTESFAFLRAVLTGDSFFSFFICEFAQMYMKYKSI
jgi:hypothetical protein